MLSSVSLSAAHAAAVNRRRRIIVQYDAWDAPLLGADIDPWLAYRFGYMDERGSQIDSLWWDIGLGGEAVFADSFLGPVTQPGLLKWQSRGIDWIQALIDACRKRGLEAFWNARVSEVETNPDGLELKTLHPIKAAHPDWTIKTWWWQGMWNFASPGLREYKVRALREVAERYDFDGCQLDFARHTPYVEVGRQWELRGEVTEYVRMVRTMLQAVAAQKRKPILLSAKVPENLRGCREDGLDVETWVKENLVDMFTLGSRTMDVDIEAFRQITAGKNIKLFPCFDDHHASDGYRSPPIELLRGISGNWWQQGADGVTTFNWSNADAETCKRMGVPPGPPSQQQAYHEVGEPAGLKYKDKIFAVERRGGYPWSEGYFNHNKYSPLPATLAYDGRATELTVRVCDDLAGEADRLNEVTLRLTIFAAQEGDRIEVQLNGTKLEEATYDFGWKDGQVFSPNPQRISGGDGIFPIDPNQKLLLLTFPVSPKIVRQGKNDVRIWVSNRIPFMPCVEIQVEKVEIHTKYY